MGAKSGIRSYVQSRPSCLSLLSTDQVKPLFLLRQMKAERAKIDDNKRRKSNCPVSLEQLGCDCSVSLHSRCPFVRRLSISQSSPLS